MSPSQRSGHLMHVTKRIQFVCFSLCLIGFLAVGLLETQDISVPLFGSDLVILCVAIAVLPAFLSHLPTAAVILSDARSDRLMVGSLITSCLSVALKYFAIDSWGVTGAVLALGIVELTSAVVFYLFYWGSSRKTFSAVVWLPASQTFIYLMGLTAWSAAQ